MQLTIRQLNILRAVMQEGDSTPKQLVKPVRSTVVRSGWPGVTPESIEQDLQSMEKQNLVRRIGRHFRLTLNGLGVVIADEEAK